MNGSGGCSAGKRKEARRQPVGSWRGDPVYGQAVPEPSLPLLNQKQTLDQTGVYLQDQITAGKLVLLAGVRHDWADSRTRSRSTGLSTKLDDTKFTGRAGIVYRFDNGLAPYVSYSTSFLPTSGADWQGHPFRPTTGRQWEAGLKFQPRGIRGFVTVSLFDLVQNNVQTPDPDTSHGPFAQVQSGRARARGVEVEGHADLTPSLSVIAAYSHLDNKVTRSNGPDLGKHPVSVPRNTASAWADYTVRKGPLSGFGLNAGVRYVGVSFADVANMQRVPGYTVFDGGLRYDFGRYRVALNAANLFDKAGVVCSNGYVSCNYIQARTVTASLRYRW